MDDAKDAAPSDAAGFLDGGSALSAVSNGLACFRYIEAKCTREAECSNARIDERWCLTAADCPEKYLVSGSKFTKMSLLDCAAAWLALDCSDALVGKAPACANSGTRAAGEACSVSSQCVSLSCQPKSAATPDDGTCAALADSGGTCPTGTVCVAGEHCEAGTCVPNLPPGLDSFFNAPVGGLGADCINRGNCEFDLYCAFVPSRPDLGRCEVPPGPPGPCGDAKNRGLSTPVRSTCNNESYCGMDEMCHPLPLIGEPCGLARYNGFMHCEVGAFCGLDGKCTPWRQLGEVCRGSASFMGVPLFPECNWNEGADCLCPDATSCNADEALCRVRVKPGAACDFEFAACLYGSECVGGICDFPDP